MGKIARTPFNAARWLTANYNSSQTIGERLSGYCLFITADTAAITLNVNYFKKGCYMKIILTDQSSHDLTVSLGAMEGVAIYDNSGVDILALGDGGETKLILPTGAAAGSYIDLICDGEKWYVQAMTHGVAWTQAV